MPDAKVDLGSASIRSGHCTDRAAAPGVNANNVAREKRAVYGYIKGQEYIRPNMAKWRHQETVEEFNSHVWFPNGRQGDGIRL